MKKIVYQNTEEKTDSENLDEFLLSKNLLGKRLIIEINNTILQKDIDFRNIKINKRYYKYISIVSGG
jgi:hypothetical protein